MKDIKINDLSGGTFDVEIKKIEKFMTRSLRIKLWIWKRLIELAFWIIKMGVSFDEQDIEDA